MQCIEENYLVLSPRRLNGRPAMRTYPTGFASGFAGFLKRQKKTAVLLAPPKFREETSKKAVRPKRVCRPYNALRKCSMQAFFLLRCSIAQWAYLAQRLYRWPMRSTFPSARVFQTSFRT